MPGYSVAGQDEGRLVPWYKAEMRLTQSRHYLLTTLWPDGRPHTTVVWAIWNQDSMWFRVGTLSRKFKNLLNDPRCTLATTDGANPVVLEGRAELIRNPALTAIFLNRVNAKYKQNYTMDSIDPTTKACFRIKPTSAIALQDEDLTGSPTKFVFDD